MSRKSTTKKKSKNRRASKDWPLIVYIWIIGLGFFGYILARIGLYDSPHPIHWLSGAMGALIGIGVGWAWYRWKGDII